MKHRDTEVTEKSGHLAESFEPGLRLFDPRVAVSERWFPEDLTVAETKIDVDDILAEDSILQRTSLFRRL